MPINFNKLGAGNALDKVLEPRKIFTSLPSKDPRYNYPRDVQTQVMEKWFERRTDRDLVIKMNTGSGKTVVGLLLLKSCLNEGVGPAVYVTPDRYLTKQALDEAAALGLLVTEDEDDPKYVSGKAILIVNIDKLINGKSKFGIGAEGSKIPIGSIVIDDAHSCLARTKEKFSLRLNVTHPAYKELLAIFREELERQSPPGILDIEQNDPHTSMLVPYWAWKDKQAQVLKILHSHKATDELKFVWPLINEVLPFCRCAFGGGELEIAPRCLPIDVVNSLHSAKRRIYMTATLADDSILVTDFQADSKLINKVIAPNSADDLGDRMILAPQELNSATTEDEIKDFLKEISEDHNVVVIVPSNKRAQFWNDVADQTLHAANVGDGVEKLKSGHVGLTVMINKYDGIDLPDDSCRILVIDGLPEVQGLLEKIEQSALDGSEVSIRNQIQRIEQGMGRGVRSNEDFCVVLLLGARLIKRMHNQTGILSFTPATRAQLELSRRMAEQLQDKPVDDLREVMDLCLDRNTDWVAASKGELISVKHPSDGTVNEIAVLQREAFDISRMKQYSQAVDLIQKAVNLEGTPRMKGWLKQQLAEYKHHVDPVESQKMLLAAAQMNRQVLRPIDGIAYQKLSSATTDQANTAVQFYRRYLESNDLIVSVNSLIEDLVFQPETANRFEAAFEELGFFLGFVGQRPENDHGKGPDVLWALGNLQYFVIECKNGATTEKINKHDCNQLAGSLNWFKLTYDASCKATPIMVHPSPVFERAASPHQDFRIITTDKLDGLRKSLRDFSKGLSQPGAMSDPVKVLGLLKHFHLTGSDFVSTFSVPYKTTP